MKKKGSNTSTTSTTTKANQNIDHVKHAMKRSLSKQRKKAPRRSTLRYDDMNIKIYKYILVLKLMILIHCNNLTLVFFFLFILDMESKKNKNKKTLPSIHEEVARSIPLADNSCAKIVVNWSSSDESVESKANKNVATTSTPFARHPNDVVQHPTTTSGDQSAQTTPGFSMLIDMIVEVPETNDFNIVNTFTNPTESSTAANATETTTANATTPAPTPTPPDYKQYDIDQFKINTMLPWDRITTTRNMYSAIFSTNFHCLFGLSSRITVHHASANSNVLKRKFSVIRLPGNANPAEICDNLKKFPYIEKNYVGNEYALCRTPLEIAIPKEFVKPFIKSINSKARYNVQLRQKWESKHIVICPRSVTNIPPTFRAVLRAILNVKPGYLSLVSNG
jgi:hypothetical protein